MRLLPTPHGRAWGSGCTVCMGEPPILIPFLLHLEHWKASAGKEVNVRSLFAPGCFGLGFLPTDLKIPERRHQRASSDGKDKSSKHATPTAAVSGAADMSSPTFHHPPIHVCTPGACDLVAGKQHAEGASRCW